MDLVQVTWHQITHESLNEFGSKNLDLRNRSMAVD